jgi:hypothetical protein
LARAREGLEFDPEEQAEKKDGKSSRTKTQARRMGPALDCSILERIRVTGLRPKVHYLKQ